jgi:hypothetical protein
MISDGVKENDEEGKLQVLDICELLWNSQKGGGRSGKLT